MDDDLEFGARLRSKAPERTERSLRGPEQFRNKNLEIFWSDSGMRFWEMIRSHSGEVEEQGSG